MRVLSHFSLENFRLFKEKTSFDLSPITILTGTNSSGKSSLIKAILLLKANFEKNKSIEEIDFSIGDHNLNDFKNSLNYDNDDDIMYFRFSCYVNDLGVRFIELGYQLDSEENSKGKLNSFSIFTVEGEMVLSATKVFDDEIGGIINYKIDIDHFIRNLDLNSLNKNIKKELYDDPNQRWGQKYWLNQNDALVSGRPNSHESRVYFEALEHIKRNGINKQSGWTPEEMSYNNQSIVEGLNNLGSEVMQWLELNFSHKAADFKRSEFGNFFFDDFSKHVLNETLKQIFYNFEAISHFSSVRSKSKKYYTKEDGELFDMLIWYSKEADNFNSEINKFIESQLTLFAFGNAVRVENYKDILAEVFVLRDGKEVLLSDLGFGFTQLLPIILKIALVSHLGNQSKEVFLAPFPGEVYEPSYPDSFLLLEEPESNLHPAFQSKIAEMIAYAASKFKIRFIIETHSEYLIRNLQYLIAKKTLINSEAVKIYYFNKPGSEEAEESLFRTIHIESNGRMTRGFGSGFFDEAESIAFELFMLNQNRQN
jgi:predicted ATPase